MLVPGVFFFKLVYEVVYLVEAYHTGTRIALQAGRAGRGFLAKHLGTSKLVLLHA